MIWCGAAAAKKSAHAESTEIPSPRPIAPFVARGIQWIIKTQHEEGGWGAGSHANQKNRDAHKGQIDPGTSAFVAREQFDTLLEAKVLIERWRRHYNRVRPHGSLGYRTPAPVAGLAVPQRVT